MYVADIRPMWGKTLHGEDYEGMLPGQIRIKKGYEGPPEVILSRLEGQRGVLDLTSPQISGKNIRVTLSGTLADFYEKCRLWDAQREEYKPKDPDQGIPDDVFYMPVDESLVQQLLVLLD